MRRSYHGGNLKIDVTTNIELEVILSLIYILTILEFLDDTIVSHASLLIQ